MKVSTASPQSLEIGRGVAFESLRYDDPKTSREAAWQAIERGDFSPDPSIGAGLDEYQFSERSGGMVGRLPTPARSGFFL
jgi:hypothetical protein